MKYKHCIKTVFNSVFALVLAFSTVTANGLNLPVKTIGGKEFYYYKVVKGDKLYQLADSWGVTRNDILKHNHNIDDGLKPGMTIYLPVEEYRGYGQIEPGNNIAASVQFDEEDDIAPVETVRNVATPSEVPVVEENAPAVSMPPVQTVIEPEHKVEAEPLNVVVCLPFMLNSEKPGRGANHSTDFYRGFLLGIDSLRSRYGNPPMKITAIDSEGFGNNLLTAPENAKAFREADIIVAPETMNRLTEIEDFGKKNGKYVFNAYQTRDSAYIHNPYALYGPAPAGVMYDKAIGWFVQNLNGAVPVILVNEAGKNDKQSFVDQLTSQLKRLGINYITVSYEGTLTNAVLDPKLPADKSKYVFVPSSSSLVEFQKYASALGSVMPNPNNLDVVLRSIRLFGYPEFTRFSGDAYDKLKSLNTSFYSRFYNDLNARETVAVNNSYVSRYGTGLPEGVPNQALYGFDVARWLVALAAQGPVSRESIVNTRTRDFSQTVYRFTPDNNLGLVNDAILVVSLSPVGEAIVEIL